MINRLVSNFPMDIFALRRANLLKLIDAPEFGGNQAKFANATGIKSPQINRWLSTTACDTRNITEKSARKLEMLCRKPTGWLDQRESSLTAQEPAPPPYIAMVKQKTKRDQCLEAINQFLLATDDVGLEVALYEAEKICGKFPLTKQTPASSQ